MVPANDPPDSINDLMRKHWNARSADYQREHEIPITHLHYGTHGATEADLHLLGEIKGKKIVEIGCGGGQNSIFLAKQGAKCTGVDFSENQIKFASELARDNNVSIEYHLRDITDLSFLPENSFDIVLGSAYALDWVYELGPVFKGARRILRPGGIFIFSKCHPFLNCFDWNSTPDRLQVVVSYFQSKIQEPDEITGQELTYPLHTLSSILNILLDAGFLIDRVIEPQVAEEQLDTGGIGWNSGLFSFEVAKMVPLNIIIKARTPL